jgi:C4-dicarboxylate-specific signal transduction histidine kinase
MLLAKAQEHLSLLSSMSGLGFWRWNRATGEVWASKHARSILGLDARTWLTRDRLLETIHPIDRAEVVQAISATAAHHSNTGEMDLRVVCQDQEIRWITANACAYRDKNGMILRVVGYVFDDSKRKRAQAESLKQQQQIKHLSRVAVLGELTGALAHQLKQPLAAILCNAETAQVLADNKRFNVEKLREILRDIVSDGMHAGQIIQNLRALLKRGELHLQRLEIAQLIGDVLKLARGTLKERNVQVDLRIEESIPPVLGDRVELQQVILNLVLNACDSMSKNAVGERRIEIVVALEPEHSAIRTSVLDFGKGIDLDQLEHIFDPFFTTKDTGLGMGLAVCRSIIVAHKGLLWATNRAQRGAEFHFTLPIIAREGEQ